jgi:hypothetical protein
MEFLGSAASTARRRFFLLHLLVLGFCLAAGPAPAQESNKEYQVKAAFLYNFIQFVKWPPEAFPTPDAPLCIGVLGDDPFDGALEDTVRGEAVNGHKLTVIRSHNPDDLRGCQMIFVSRSAQGQMDQILAAVNDRPVLTVGEIDRFAEEGGDINFYLSAGKIRFEINPGAAKHCGLKISSQLLALGRIVGGDN